jgi:hypothetical protein
MSEEETLIEENPVEEAAAEEVVESTEVEAAAPEEGEKPEWLKDKYKSVEDQAKAYAELEKKFGGFTGSPEGDYEMKVPEGISGEYDMDDPRIEWFQDVAKENNMSQATFDQMLSGFVKMEQEANDPEAAKNIEIQALGKNANARLRDLGDWGKANLDTDQYEGFKGLATTAAGVQVLEALIAKTGEGKMPTSNTVRSPGLTKEMLDDMIADPKYQTSAAYRSEVAQKFVDYHGE